MTAIVVTADTRDHGIPFSIIGMMDSLASDVECAALLYLVEAYEPPSILSLYVVPIETHWVHWGDHVQDGHGLDVLRRTLVFTARVQGAATV